MDSIATLDAVRFYPDYRAKEYTDLTVSHPENPMVNEADFFLPERLKQGTLMQCKICWFSHTMSMRCFMHLEETQELNSLLIEDRNGFIPRI
ncbi:hypothetical protein [Amylolactobacillus amylophilus]|uniref:hypothetical protein n=1 Tax=Amylolactobacillus amylophilus TaxID=1603 RepID=UPI000A6ADA6C|nr:hypothetical protein [Amylolactobacillus amylophilus]